MLNCSQALDKIRTSFVNGHLEYEKQENAGTCVRSTDGQNNGYTDMLDSGSVQECAQACNADSTCVAFDRSTSGNCDAYQLDPAANFVGSGSGDWSCYTKVTLPDYCSSAYLDVVTSFHTFEA